MPEGPRLMTLSTGMTLSDNFWYTTETSSSAVLAADAPFNLNNPLNGTGNP